MLTDMLLAMAGIWDGLEASAHEVYEGYCQLSTEGKILSGVMVVAGVAALVLLPSDRYPEE